MKKAKIFTKSQIALAVMVVALAGAIWLNMKYSSDDTAAGTDTSSKYLGQAEYVNNEVTGETDNTSSDPAAVYFDSLRDDRLEAREEAYAMLEETLKSTELSEENKKSAVDRAAELASRTEKEAAIETLLKAKGFSTTVAVIGDEDVNIIVKSEEMLPAQTVQIQDAVLSQTDFAVSNIKIVAMTEDEIKNALK